MTMTIYDLLRHFIEQTGWPANGDVASRARKEAALRLVQRLEEMGLLGQVAIEIKEEV